MDAALTNVIDDDGLRARQAVLPSNASPRLDIIKLPIIKLTGLLHAKGVLLQSFGSRPSTPSTTPFADIDPVLLQKPRVLQANVLSHGGLLPRLPRAALSQKWTVVRAERLFEVNLRLW
jgi:hypothetical protein